MTEQPQEASIVFGITRKSLEATIIHACPHCGGPGVYRCDEYTLKNWPGCWAPTLAFKPGWPSHNKPVGDTCPNCHKRRRGDKNLGELTSSMPRWIWQCILAVKWCVIKLVALKRRTGERYG